MFSYKIATILLNVYSYCQALKNFGKKIIGVKKWKVIGLIFGLFLVNLLGYSTIVSADTTQSLNQIVSTESRISDNNTQLTNADKLSRSNPENGQPIIASGKQVVLNNSHGNGISSRAEVPVTNITWHLSEEYISGKFRVNFWIDSIEGVPPAAVDVQIEFNTEPTLAGPVNANTLAPISKIGGLQTGLLGFTELPAKTTFFNVAGAVGFIGVNGAANVKPIPPTAIYLQNKIGQNFPEYVDPVSKKDAETPIDTTWTKLSKSPSWSSKDRYIYIKTFSETYGNQSADFWSSREVHHIRPRVYGGTNDFNNLMPVLTPNHRLITAWFNNY